MTLRRTPVALAVALALIISSCGSTTAGDAGPRTTFETAAGSADGSQETPTSAAASTIAPATSERAATTAPPPTVTTTAPTTTTEPSLQPAAVYEPKSTDVLLERKRLGGRFAQALLTYEPEDTVESHTDGLRVEFGILDSEGLIELTREAMAEGSQSVGTVRYAQMGGNRATKASLMVWVDVERLDAASQLTIESRVVDVRVELIGDEWRVVRLASAGGPAVERPDDLSELAASVVDHPEISMPDSARWDIYSGHTTPEMLERMIEVAEITDYSVLVLNRGHPYRVFATQSISRHSVGQAMDVYEVGGQLVVDSRFEDSPTWKLARTLFDGGIRSIGSPWAFDGFGGRSFTDDVHQDHLHITS